MSNALILTCDGCGTEQYDRDDMLEAYFPEVSIPATPAFPVALHPLSLGWVGPCCASMAIIRRAAFLRDVQVGDRFQLTTKDEPPWLVTGREVAETDDFLTGKTRALIVLVGQDDDGNPKTQMGAPWVTVIIHVAVPASDGAS